MQGTLESKVLSFDLTHFILLGMVSLKIRDIFCFLVLFGSGYELKCSRVTRLLSRPSQISTEREHPQLCACCARILGILGSLENQHPLLKDESYALGLVRRPVKKFFKLGKVLHFGKPC